MVLQGALFQSNLGYIPPPKPRLKYEPAEESPMWDLTRLWWGSKLEERAKEFSPIGTQPASPDDPDWRGVVENEVIAMPRPEPYKFGQPYHDRYFWFDTPDYADPFKKLGYAFRFLAATGVFTTSFLAILASKKFNTESVLYYYRFFLGPWIWGGMTGATTVVTVANLRGQKDDYWNYAAGTVAFASVFGRSSYHAFARALVLGSFAVVAKHNAEINGFMSYPTTVHRQISPGLGGLDTKHGFWSGDWRFGYTSNHGDPGRDTRRMI